MTDHLAAVIAAYEAAAEIALDQAPVTQDFNHTQLADLAERISQAILTRAAAVAANPALLGLEGVPQVRVKPLVWQAAPKQLCHVHWMAPAFCGAYHIAPDEDSAAGAWVTQWVIHPDDFCMVYGGEIRRYPSAQAAEAAAQADYESRILAAIDTVASGGKMGDRKGMNMTEAERKAWEAGRDAAAGAAHDYMIAQGFFDAYHQAAAIAATIRALTPPKESTP